MDPSLHQISPLSRLQGRGSDSDDDESGLKSNAGKGVEPKILFTRPSRFKSL